MLWAVFYNFVVRFCQEQRCMAKTKYAAEVQLLSDVAQVFAESLDLEETLKSILKSLDTHLKLRRGTITLLNPETETLDIEVAHGLSEKSKTLGSYKVGEGITGRVVATGEEIVVPDIAKDPRFLHKTRSRKQAIVRPRQIAMFLARRYTDAPLQAIGKSFNRYHATALHAINTIENEVRKKTAIQRQVKMLASKLETGQHE